MAVTPNQIVTAMELPDSRLLWLYSKHIQPAVASGNKATYHSCCHCINKRGRHNTSDVHKSSISIAHLFKERDHDEDKIKDLKEFLANLPEELPFFPLINQATCGYNREEIMDVDVPANDHYECRFCLARASRENETRQLTQTIERQTSPINTSLDCEQLGILYQYSDTRKPLHFDRSEPSVFMEKIIPGMIESNSHFTFEASNEWSEEYSFLQKDQPEIEKEERQPIIIELNQKMKAQDQTIKKMSEALENLKKENLSLQMKYDHMRLNPLHIVNMDLKSIDLPIDHCKKRPPKVSLPLLKKKKPEVNSTDDLSRRITEMIKVHNSKKY